MDSEPPPPPSSDETSSPAGEPEPAGGLEPAAEPKPAAEAPAPHADVGPVPPPAPPPRPARGMRQLIAMVVVVIIVVVAVIGYAVAGYAYGQSQLNTAQNAYNGVVERQNKLTDAVSTLNIKLSGSTLSDAASIQAAKATVSQLISQSESAQSQIQTDDAVLAKADEDLKQNQWLTVISRSSLDRLATRIAHRRKALADAKTITADYVQLGNFYQAFLDVASDLAIVSGSSSDFTAMTAAIQKLKTDTAKAVSLDKAPGLPPEVDPLMRLFQTLANDFSNVINAAVSGDTAAYDAAVAALNSDLDKLNATDTSKLEGAVQAFYKPLIDDYNSENDKANAT